jgi:hypothetical protein
MAMQGYHNDPQGCRCGRLGPFPFQELGVGVSDDVTGKEPPRNAALTFCIFRDTIAYADGGP